VIDAENSDLFDVLAHVAFASEPVARSQRATWAKSQLGDQFSYRQREFIYFVLGQYVTEGVDELDQEKLTSLLRLRYKNALADAVQELGPPDQIRTKFVEFQRFLYNR